MASDSSGGLHYSGDVTEEISEPQLTYTNPHGQRVGPRWVHGKMVFAMPAGIVHIDPEKQKWAKEFVVVYSVDGPDGRSERLKTVPQLELASSAHRPRRRPTPKAKG